RGTLVERGDEARDRRGLILVRRRRHVARDRRTEEGIGGDVALLDDQEAARLEPPHDLARRSDVGAQLLERDLRALGQEREHLLLLRAAARVARRAAGSHEEGLSRRDGAARERLVLVGEAVAPEAPRGLARERGRRGAQDVADRVEVV